MATFSMEEKHQTARSWTDGLFERVGESVNVFPKEIKKLEEFITDEEFDTDAIINDVEDFQGHRVTKRMIMNISNLIHILNNDKTKLDIILQYSNDSTLYDSSFSTGFIFYYWPYYKNKVRIRHNYDINYTPKELYIVQKYASLEVEILDNMICTIDKYLWRDITEKARQYAETDKFKSISSYSDYIHSGIKLHSKLTIENVICIILYCDYSMLCTAFSSTFRRKRSFELVSSIKRRNREYWNLSKILRETVELFGDHKGYFDETAQKWTGATGPFYCGMSFVCIIPQFNIRLFGPTSTSKCIEVATRFGGDHGLIIELNNSGDWSSEYLRCFNCSWVSNFMAEEERLFFGGRHRIKVESVRNLETRIDYRNILHALFYFDSMLNGSEMQTDAENKISIRDVDIIEKLIKHKMRRYTNRYDAYINKTFELFCAQRRQIAFNLHQMDTCFYKFRFLMFKEGSNLPKFMVFRLFKNLDKITLKTTTQRPHNKYVFPLIKLCQVVDSASAAGNYNVQIIVKAHWKISFDYQKMDRSWIYEELVSRTVLNHRIYVTELTTDQTQNRFPQDCFTIMKA
eukprot:418378_1